MNLNMNRRGGLFDIFIVLIVFFVVFIFFSAWIYGFGILTDQIASVEVTNSLVNVSNIGGQTFGAINNALPALRWLGLVIVIAMFLGIMISNFLVKAHPVFLLVFVLITLVAVVFSVHLTNAYESILVSSNPISTELQNNTGLNFIMLHLPIFTTIIGLGGAIFLFIGIIVDKQQGGSVPL